MMKIIKEEYYKKLMKNLEELRKKEKDPDNKVLIIDIYNELKKAENLYEF